MNLGAKIQYLVIIMYICTLKSKKYRHKMLYFQTITQGVLLGFALGGTSFLRTHTNKHKQRFSCWLADGFWCIY